MHGGFDKGLLPGSNAGWKDQIRHFGTVQKQDREAHVSGIAPLF